MHKNSAELDTYKNPNRLRSIDLVTEQDLSTLNRDFSTCSKGLENGVFLPKILRSSIN